MTEGLGLVGRGRELARRLKVSEEEALTGETDLKEISRRASRVRLPLLGGARLGDVEG